ASGGRGHRRGRPPPHPGRGLIRRKAPPPGRTRRAPPPPAPLPAAALPLPQPPGTTPGGGGPPTSPGIPHGPARDPHSPAMTAPPRGVHLPPRGAAGPRPPQPPPGGRPRLPPPPLELRGNRAVQAHQRDDLAAERAPGRAAPGAEHAAARGRLCPALRRAQPGR